MEPSITKLGTVKGIMGSINIHPSAWYFILYSALLPPITCYFAREKLQEVTHHFQKTITVYGLITTRENGRVLRVKETEIQSCED